MLSENIFIQLDITKTKIANEKGTNVFELLTEQAQKIKPGSDGLMHFPYLGNTLSPNWNSSDVGNCKASNSGQTTRKLYF